MYKLHLQLQPRACLQTFLKTNAELVDCTCRYSKRVTDSPPFFTTVQITYLEIGLSCLCQWCYDSSVRVREVSHEQIYSTGQDTTISSLKNGLRVIYEWCFSYFAKKKLQDLLYARGHITYPPVVGADQEAIQWCCVPSTRSRTAKEGRWKVWDESSTTSDNS